MVEEDSDDYTNFEDQFNEFKKHHSNANERNTIVSHNHDSPPTDR
jgi:hypothetical protein